MKLKKKLIYKRIPIKTYIYKKLKKKVLLISLCITNFLINIFTYHHVYPVIKMKYSFNIYY